MSCNRPESKQRMQTLAGQQTIAPRARIFVATLGARTFGVVLVVSGFLKAQSPWPAIHSLAWTAWPDAMRQWLVHCTTAWEVLIGTGLVLIPSRRWALYLGMGTSVLLMIAHVLGLTIGGVDDCGCFGDLRVHQTAVLCLLGAGLLVCWYASRWPESGAAVAKWKLPVAVAVFIGATSPLVLEVRAESAVQQLVRRLAIAPADDVLVVVGSTDCPHCAKELTSLAAQRASSPEAQPAGVVLVRPESDRQTWPEHMRWPWLQVREIPENLWWRLLLDAPPSFVRVKPGLEPAVRKTWK